MKNIFRKLILPAAMLLSMESMAQDVLVVTPEFKKNSNYEFNNEWHYLTSEMYLFNGSKFQNLVNDLYLNVPKKTRATLANPENILITAKIDGTALGNLSYPIFNFNVDNSNGQLKTYTSDSYEAIRIMDNLPLSSLNNGKIDCHINIDLITQDKPNMIFDFVASQLKQISSWTTTPLSAAKTLVGELGNLITTKTTKKEYKFNSTIRLYEQDDFSKRVASISVYSFIPAKLRKAYIDSTSICKYIDNNDNPKLDRARLNTLVRYDRYPYMVIVNYKSKYVSEPVIGDETTTETVDARLAKVKKAYESGLLSADIYAQEVKLVEYLYSFVTLKSSINNYMLNYKNKITDDFRMQYTQIFDNYIALRSLFTSRNKEFGKNGIFINEFLPTYNSILTNAEVYLDGDNNLRNIKNIAKILMDSKPASFDAQKNEQTLATLHSIEFPTDHPEFNNLSNLNDLIQKLEKEQYQKVFNQKIIKLKSMKPGADATEYCNELKNEMNATYCRSCRESVNSAINDYLQRVDAENLKAAQTRLANTIANAKDQIFSILQKEKVLRKHFENDYGDTLPDDVEYIHEEFLRLQANREKLQSAIKKDYSDQNTTQLNLISDNIEYESQDLAKILEGICKKMPELCE